MEATYSSKRLDHLGLVAGICQELGIAKTIDNLLPNESADKIVSTGTGVIAMLLNGLGFVNKRLYLVKDFFEGKPLDKLLGVSYLKPEHLNDDALGRCLDSLDSYGVDTLFSLLSQDAISYLSAHYELSLGGMQLDNTTFSLYSGEKELMESGVSILEITQGYSKDHRPDLVQIGLQLIVESKSRIPLLMRALSGNKEEGKSYGEVIEAHIGQLQMAYPGIPLIGDSKMYTQENLSYMSNHPDLYWISRVPASLSEVKELTQHIQKSQLQAVENHPGYSYTEIGRYYGGVKQKWLILFSESLYKSNLAQLDKKYAKSLQKEKKAFEQLSRQKFSCMEDGQKAVEKLKKSFIYSYLEDIEFLPKYTYAKKGKPAKGDKPLKTDYYLRASLATNEQIYEQEKSALGYFILASNQLTVDVSQILSSYKDQSVAEKSFRFLKDPKIVASSFFVQKPERIRALLFIMTLCLLVYAVLEYKIRAELVKQEQSVEDRLGKPTQSPTLRWVFEYFEGIELLYENQKLKSVLNLKPKHKKVLDLLGDKYWHFYT